MKKFGVLTVLTIICIILIFCFRGVFSTHSNEAKTNNIDVTESSQQVSITDKIYKSAPVINNNELQKKDTTNKMSSETASNSTIETSSEAKQVHNKTKAEVTAKATDNNKDSTVSEEKKPSNKNESTILTKNVDRKIDPKKPMVALTFDDGPHYKYTKNILNSLKKYNAVATFFVLGDRAEKNKDIIKCMAENGNQIGNHTYDHKYLTKLSTTEINNEINKTSDIIYNITNIRPSVLRPTYGAVNDNVKLNTNVPLILWSVDTRDWQSRDEKSVVNKALKNVKDGEIILMHDIYKSTASAADVIIKELTSKGYQLVTVDELFHAKEVKLVKGTVYSHAY